MLGKATVAPTPRDTLFRDGSARIYRFRRPKGLPAAGAMPLLLVPSLINQWYVLDLREGASLVRALVRGGVDTYCLDWGVAQDEDRHLTWEDVLDRLARAVRRVKRETGASKVGVLGYCMGGTLSAIHAALHDDVAALVNLCGPIDFARGGMLRDMVDPKWFDAQAIADAGNVGPHQMQSGFVALRPTGTIAKWVALADRALDPQFIEAFDALETWSSDNVPFPGAAYATYIRELYQENALVRGEHHVRGRRVDLANIVCPVLTVCAEKDAICPPGAARALCDHAGAKTRDVIMVPGGHVGAVVGSRAPKVLYPAIVDWLKEKLATGEAPASRLEDTCN